MNIFCICSKKLHTTACIIINQKSHIIMVNDIKKETEFPEKFSELQKQLIQQNVNLINEVEDKTAELV